MTTRTTAPAGAPCWIDLWTPDVDGSRRFYAELFGWEAQEPSEEFGGYFMWTRDGVPVAGGMGPMGDMPAGNAWKMYLSVEDVTKTIDIVESVGASIVSGAMQVADLGSQAVFVDAVGAHLGAWQPETFPGFTVLGEHGSPSWFELHTRDYRGALDFYQSAFAWDVTSVGDSDDFRYSTAKPATGGNDIVGVMDSAGFLPEGAASHWAIYWEVDDVDAAVATAESNGGAVVVPAEDTPYGRLATLTDVTGAEFRLRTSPR